jgi:hypothetical protein
MVTNVTNHSRPVKNKCDQILPINIVDGTQPIVTNCVVEKPKQAHFYIPPALREKCEAIFDQQGVKFSEGMTRLAKLLVEAPKELWPVLLHQAPGDAAIDLAESVIARSLDKGKVMRIAGKKE